MKNNFDEIKEHCTPVDISVHSELNKSVESLKEQVVGLLENRGIHEVGAELLFEQADKIKRLAREAMERDYDVRHSLIDTMRILEDYHRGFVTYHKEPWSSEQIMILDKKRNEQLQSLIEHVASVLQNAIMQWPPI